MLIGAKGALAPPGGRANGDPVVRKHQGGSKTRPRITSIGGNQQSSLTEHKKRANSLPTLFMLILLMWKSNLIVNYSELLLMNYALVLIMERAVTLLNLHPVPLVVMQFLQGLDLELEIATS
jgi:hypothetical protein